MSGETITILVAILVGLPALISFFQQKSPLWVRIVAGVVIIMLVILGGITLFNSKGSSGNTVVSTTAQPVISPTDDTAQTAIPAPTQATVEQAPVSATLAPTAEQSTEALQTIVSTPTETSVTDSNISPGKDIPGPLITSGARIKGVVDSSSRPRDVYSIQMKAGQEAKVLVKSSEGLFVAFAVPGANSFDSQGNVLCQYSTTCDKLFYAAVDGEYYIAVYTNYPSISYDLVITLSDAITMADRGDDIPGVALPASGKAESIVDAGSKKRDVYSIQMKAGQEAKVLVKSSEGLFVAFAVPGSGSFDSKSNVLCQYSTTCDKRFYAAVEGEYYIAVYTNYPSISYTVSVVVADSITMAERGDDIPGVAFPASGKAESVVDMDTKDRDVYAIQMKAGQEAKVLVKSSDALFVAFATPEVASFDGQGTNVCQYTTTCDENFSAAVDGEYYIAVYANGASIAYSISVTVN